MAENGPRWAFLGNDRFFAGSEGHQVHGEELAVIVSKDAKAGEFGDKAQRRSAERFHADQPGD